MTSYYYLDDPEGDMGMFPVPEEEMVAALYLLAAKGGVTITDQMILNEVYKRDSDLESSKKIFLYVDGTNLFAGQLDLFGLSSLLPFKVLLKEINKLIKIDEICFYSSYMSRKDHRKLSKFFTAEALFYHDVRKTKGVYFYQGHRSPTSGKEKGVDVHLAVDIVRNAIGGACRKIVIMTGDADFIYPLEIAKQFNIPTAAIFLPNRFSLEMAYKVNEAYVLDYGGKFKALRKLPGQLKIVKCTKKPRM